MPCGHRVARLEETCMARGLVAFYSRSGDINYAGDGVATLSALCYIRRAHNSEVLDSNPVPATMNLELGGLTTFELFVTVAVPQDCEKFQKLCYRVTENSELKTNFCTQLQNFVNKYKRSYLNPGLICQIGLATTGEGAGSRARSSVWVMPTSP